MTDLEKEKENLAQTGKYLEQLGIAYGVKNVLNEEGGMFPCIFTTYQYKGYTFDLTIQNIGDWIIMKCLILDLSTFSDEQVLSLYELGLDLNYILPETTFSAHKRKLYVEADMVLGASFEDFKDNLNSIAVGIDVFTDELDPGQAELKNTEGKADRETQKRKE